MFREPVNNSKWFLKKVEVKKSEVSGLGVFATETISKNEMFESCPVILFHKVIIEDYHRFHSTNRHLLDDYVFKWRNGNFAIAMGYGSVYNHSNHSNAVYRSRADDGDPRIEFVAKRDISPGEEIFIHYIQGKGDLDFSGSGTCFQMTVASVRDSTILSHTKAPRESTEHTRSSMQGQFLEAAKLDDID